MFARDIGAGLLRKNLTVSLVFLLGRYYRDYC